MLQGLYGVATAMDAAGTGQDVVARNLAHVDVPGFRRSFLVKETFENALDESERTEATSLLGTSAHAPATDFTPGRYQSTGRPLDLAIDGDGFFVLDGPTGPLYTRNGVFHLDETGELVNPHGISVRGAGGAIVIPPGTDLTTLVVGPDGTVSAGGQPVGVLELTAFDNSDALIPSGTTTFEAPPEAGERPADVVVQQGTRELSNVSAVDELVQMISGMRYMESAQRAFKLIAETIARDTDPDGA